LVAMAVSGEVKDVQSADGRPEHESASEVKKDDVGAQAQPECDRASDGKKDGVGGDNQPEQGDTAVTGASGPADGLVPGKEIEPPPGLPAGWVAIERKYQTGGEAGKAYVRFNGGVDNRHRGVLSVREAVRRDAIDRGLDVESVVGNYEKLKKAQAADRIKDRAKALEAKAAKGTMALTSMFKTSVKKTTSEAVAESSAAAVPATPPKSGATSASCVVTPAPKDKAAVKATPSPVQKTLFGKRLDEQASEPKPEGEFGLFRVDNSRFKAGSDGLGFRRTKDLTDMDEEAWCAVWGSHMEGHDDGNGWLQCGNRFLPFCIDGTPVLLPKANFYTAAKAARKGEKRAAPQDGAGEAKAEGEEAMKKRKVAKGEDDKPSGLSGKQKKAARSFLKRRIPGVPVS